MKSYHNLKAFASFTATVAGLVLVLLFMNWLPFTVQKNSLREFSSMEQVRSTLGLRTVFIPAYFPQGIGWPPSRILGQDKPFPALIMEFSRAGSHEVILLVSQSSGGTMDGLHTLEPVTVRETVPFVLHQNTAVLTVGECADREVCSSITWSEQDHSITVQMRSTPFELKKIAESMHP